MRALFVSMLLFCTAIAFAQPDIKAGEYFIGSADPGSGNGISFTVEDGAWDELVEKMVASAQTINNTSSPFLINVRLKDNTNKWGPLFKKSVFINSSATNTRPVKINYAEYFFGVIDPGENNGTAILAFDGAFDEAVETVLKTQASVTLTSGFTLFNIRLKDANNNWGPLFKKSIFLNPGVGNARSTSITYAEYFFGVFDPGENSGTPMLAFDGVFDEAIETVLKTQSSVTLTTGFTLFNIRIKDAYNNWGPLFKKSIFLNPGEGNSRSTSITYAEYFFGVFDPGEGNGTPIVAFDGAFDEAVETVLRKQATWSISSGPNLFNVRLKDAYNNWGPLYKKAIFPYGANPNAQLIAEGDTIKVCNNSNVTLTYNGPNGYTPTWFNGSNNNSITFTASTVGYYAVTATLANSIYKDSIYVAFLPSPNPSISPTGSILVCASSVVTLNTPVVSNTTYQWFYNGTAITGATNANYLPSQIGSYYVVATSTSSGCKGTSPTTTLFTSATLTPTGTVNSCSSPVTLTAASGTGNTFQWRRNGVVISGATSSTYAATSNGSYTVTINNGSCSSLSPATNITISAGVLSAPVAVNNSRCGAGSIAISATVPTGQTVDWYMASTGGTPILSNSTSLTQNISTTTTFYAEARNTSSGCISSSRTAVIARINNTTSSTTNMTRCSNNIPVIWNGTNYSTSGTYTSTITNSAGCDSLAILNLSIVQPSTSTTNALICATSLPYIWNGTSYSVSGSYTKILTATNGCDSTAILNLTVSNGTPTAPTTITQRLIDTTCGARIYRYTSGLVTNANAYAWMIPSTLGGIPGVIVDSGNINSSSTIRLKFVSNTGALTTDSLKVRAYSGCGTSVFKAFKLTNVALNPPAVPASITIQKIVDSQCGKPRYRYIAPVLPNATGTIARASGYNWMFTGSLGTLAVVDSGSLSSRIFTVYFNSNLASALSGDSIKVRYTSGCGFSAYKAVKLTNTQTGINPPLSPASVTQTLVSDVCGARVYRYTAPALPIGNTTNSAATGYSWSLPIGPLGSTGILDSGSLSCATCRTIKVKYSSNAGALTGDSIGLRYTSLCGLSPKKSFKLVVPVSPPLAPASLTQTLVSNVCGARVYRYSTMALPAGTSATGYNWQFKGSLFGTLNTNSFIDSGTLSSRTLLIRYTSNLASATGDSAKVQYNSVCGVGAFKAAKLINVALACPNATVRNIAGHLQGSNIGLDAQLYPNPSAGSFQLKISSSKTTPIKVVVRNAEGQLIKSFWAQANAINNLGGELKGGVYMVYISQGDDMKVLKAVKL